MEMPRKMIFKGRIMEKFTEYVSFELDFEA